MVRQPSYRNLNLDKKLAANNRLLVLGMALIIASLFIVLNAAIHHINIPLIPGGLPIVTLLMTGTALGAISALNYDKAEAEKGSDFANWAKETYGVHLTPDQTKTLIVYKNPVQLDTVIWTTSSRRNVKNEEIITLERSTINE